MNQNPGIIGKKIGMTQIFDEAGVVHPVTVIQVGPCVITQIKTQAKDGYDAAQIGLVEFVKASKINKAMTGHFAKSNVPPVNLVKEVQLESVTGGDDLENGIVGQGSISYSYNDSHSGAVYTGTFDGFPIFTYGGTYSGPEAGDFFSTSPTSCKTQVLCIRSSVCPER